MNPAEGERRTRKRVHVALVTIGLLGAAVLTVALQVGSSDTELFYWLWLKFGP
jgi:hypothetical protein